MFNETTYHLGDAAACQAIRERCLQQWPDDDQGIKGPANQGLIKCLVDAGYMPPVGTSGTAKCYESKIYDLPGATTYPWDVLTNPANPNFVWQFPSLNNIDPKSLGFGAAAGIIAAGALVLFLLLRR